MINCTNVPSTTPPSQNPNSTGANELSVVHTFLQLLAVLKQHWNWTWHKKNSAYLNRVLQLAIEKRTALCVLCGVDVSRSCMYVYTVLVLLWFLLIDTHRLSFSISTSVLKVSSQLWFALLQHSVIFCKNLEFVFVWHPSCCCHPSQNPKKKTLINNTPTRSKWVGWEGESNLPGRNAPTVCPVGWSAEQWTRMQACHRCHHSLMSFLLAAWNFLAGRRTLVSDEADDDEQASMSVVASSKRPLTWHQVPWTAALLPSISNVGGGLVVPSSSSLLHTAPPPSLLTTKPWTQNTTNTQQFQFHIYTHR